MGSIVGKIRGVLACGVAGMVMGGAIGAIVALFAPPATLIAGSAVLTGTLAGAVIGGGVLAVAGGIVGNRIGRAQMHQAAQSEEMTIAATPSLAQGMAAEQESSRFRDMVDRQRALTAQQTR